MALVCEIIEQDNQLVHKYFDFLSISDCSVFITSHLYLSDISKQTVSTNLEYRWPKIITDVPPGDCLKLIRSLLDKIEADDHDATTLARLMFCIFHPFRNLLEIKTKLTNSGVKYQERQQQVNAVRQMRLEIEMLREAHEMGERAKSQTTKTPKLEELETDSAKIEQIIKKEAEQPKISSPVAKRARIEEVTNENSDFARQIQPLSDQTCEGDNSVSLPTSTSTAAQSLVGDQERSCNYRSLLHSIHSYTVVLKKLLFQNPSIEHSRRTERARNLQQDEKTTLSERTIVYAIQKGIQDFPTKIKPEPLKRSVTFRLSEYFQFWQYKLLDIGFSEDHELVLQVENHATDPDRQVTILPLNPGISYPIKRCNLLEIPGHSARYCWEMTAY
uniref:Uncharacterized protein n=1 Tax=Caenorhabditis brenneri TaxID=135651 RepID=B6VBB0_CAEBE|nr:hypothetical protein Cbre_JD02.002 [Caenorhabditis brenneri]